MKVTSIKGTSGWFNWTNSKHVHPCMWCSQVVLKKFINCPRCGMRILKKSSPGEK